MKTSGIHCHLFMLLCFTRVSHGPFVFVVLLRRLLYTCLWRLRGSPGSATCLGDLFSRLQILCTQNDGSRSHPSSTMARRSEVNTRSIRCLSEDNGERVLQVVDLDDRGPTQLTEWAHATKDSKGPASGHAHDAAIDRRVVRQ